MNTLILLRHGESEWNLENKFTGWTDVDLSEKGREEAARAGSLIHRADIDLRYCFTSYLKRAIHTLNIALSEMNRDWIPVVKDWHLNERHYGALQGLNKSETANKYGDEQVHIWRRSFDICPPPLSKDDPRWPGHDPRYKDLPETDLPVTESLKITIDRVRPCWEEKIVPAIQLYKNVIVTAHGNSLRGLAKMLLNIGDKEISQLEIPTGAPWVFHLDSDFRVIENKYL